MISEETIAKVAKRIQERDGCTAIQARKSAELWARKKKIAADMLAHASQEATPDKCVCAPYLRAEGRTSPRCKFPACVAIEDEKRRANRSAYSGSSGNF